MTQTFATDYIRDRLTLTPTAGYEFVRDPETGKFVIDDGKLVIAKKGT